MRRSRPVFVLDQNFPDPLLREALSRSVPELELPALRDLEPRLCQDHEDWQVLLALSGMGVDGFITCDAEMIWRPEVIAVIQHEAFAVVVCAEAGHDPLRATGLLLTHLPSVRKRFDSRRPQLWILKATEVRPDRCFAAQQAGLRARGIRLDDYVIGPGGLEPPTL